jgi:hypothetical protein
MFVPRRFRGILSEKTFVSRWKRRFVVALSAKGAVLPPQCRPRAQSPIMNICRVG